MTVGSLPIDHPDREEEGSFVHAWQPADGLSIDAVGLKDLRFYARDGLPDYWLVQFETQESAMAALERLWNETPWVVYSLIVEVEGKQVWP